MVHAIPHARALIGALVMALLVVSAAPAAAVVREDGPRNVVESANAYIVRLSEQPVVAHEGGIEGLEATRTDGKKLNAKDAKVRRYVAPPETRPNDVAAAGGVKTKCYHYYYPNNGFAATLTQSQANALRKRSDVESVEKDQLGQIDTATTPAFLGLSDTGTGLRDQLGGVGKAGENVIVGIVDTGIWPEHPSFSDQTDLSDPQGNTGKRSLAYGPAPAGWSGTCQAGELFSSTECNNKLI